MKPIVTLDDVQDDEEQASKMNVSQPLFFLSFLIGSPAKNLAVFHQEPATGEAPRPRGQQGEVTAWGGAWAAPMEGRWWRKEEGEEVGGGGGCKEGRRWKGGGRPRVLAGP